LAERAGWKAVFLGPAVPLEIFLIAIGSEMKGRLSRPVEVLVRGSSQLIPEIEAQLVKDLQQGAGQFPTYGSRRLSQQLRRPSYGYQLNRKRIQRLMR
jgi:hypothetical protein